MGAGASPEPPRPREVSVSLGLSGPARLVRRVVPRPLRSAAAAVNRVDRRIDTALRPEVRPQHGEVVGCSVPCRATLTGLADLPSQHRQHGATDLYLLRLAVERPDGPVEVCVRQVVDPAHQATIGPGTVLPVLADPADRTRAVVRWDLPPGGFWERSQFAFPSPAEWPAPGRIEVRDEVRHLRELAERRATWTSVWARLLAIGTDRGRRDGRRLHDVDLELATGGVIRTRQRIPNLARPRIPATPWLPALTDGRTACIDWEAMLNR